MRAPIVNRYPHETSEFQPVTVTVDGEVVTEDVEFSIALNPARPTVWTAPVVDGLRIGVMVEDLPKGTYTVWARITSDLETPVVECGDFVVT